MAQNGELGLQVSANSFDWFHACVTCVNAVFSACVACVNAVFSLYVLLGKITKLNQ